MALFFHVTQSAKEHDQIEEHLEYKTLVVFFLYTMAAAFILLLKRNIRNTRDILKHFVIIPKQIIIITILIILNIYIAIFFEVTEI